jgi:coenzyme F420-reducing hydrogenase beta subunit
VDEVIGIYRQAFVGRATHPDIKARAQDGGVVTALLAYALESKLIDAAIVAGRDEKWVARPKVVTKYEDLVKNAGTKYTPSPTILGVRSALYEHGKSKIGLVGTPCQIRAVRTIQTSPLRNHQLADAMTLSIGLFCMESYKYDNLVNYLVSKGVDPKTLTKVGVKKGQFVASSGETEVLAVPLKEIDQFVRGSCDRCDDFTAEYADVSVGAIGAPSGYSAIIARTQTGLDLLMAATKAGYVQLRELKQDAKGFQRVLNMSQMKKSRNRLVEARMRRLGFQGSALIETLHSVQEAFGYLDKGNLQYVASSLRVPLSRVYGVATFYHFFTLKPKGKHVCVVCMGTACYIRGAQGLLANVEETAQTKRGETSSNGQISLLTARCLGSCGLAPNAVFDGEVVGKLTPSEVHKRVQELLQK